MGDRLALIVATNVYEDEGLHSLNAPAHDAFELESVLSDESIGGYEVRTLLDANAQEVRIAVEDLFSNRTPDDTVLLHFSCHGFKNDAGKLLLATKDTRLQYPAATSIAAEYVSSLMLNTRARRSVLFLDCCYGGAFERGLTRAGSDAHVIDSFQEHRESSSERGRIVITASSALQYAFDGDRLTSDSMTQPSIFTGALVEALRSGEADLDNDGKISASELFEYVRKKVATLTPHQTPQMWTFGAYGEIFLANVKNKSFRPAPLPVDIRDAASAPDIMRRLGAATALEYILLGEDVPAALSAVEVLVQLAEDDSKKVAKAASDALRVARPKLDRVTLQLPADGSFAAPVKLTGPAVALATAQIAKSENWMVSTITPDGITVRLADTSTDSLEGEIAIETVTGLVRLSVKHGPSETKPPHIFIPETPEVNKAFVPTRGGAESEGAVRFVRDQRNAGPYIAQPQTFGASHPDATKGMLVLLRPVIKLSQKGSASTRVFNRPIVIGLFIVVAVLQLLSPFFPYGTYSVGASLAVELQQEFVPLWPLLIAAALSLWIAFDLWRNISPHSRWWILWVNIICSWAAFGSLPDTSQIQTYGSGSNLLMPALLSQLLWPCIVRRKMVKAEPSSDASTEFDLTPS